MKHFRNERGKVLVNEYLSSTFPGKTELSLKKLMNSCLRDVALSEGHMNAPSLYEGDLNIINTIFFQKIKSAQAPHCLLYFL